MSDPTSADNLLDETSLKDILEPPDTNASPSELEIDGMSMDEVLEGSPEEQFVRHSSDVTVVEGDPPVEDSLEPPSSSLDRER